MAAFFQMSATGSAVFQIDASPSVVPPAVPHTRAGVVGDGELVGVVVAGVEERPPSLPV
jgi:hypothetical protein